MLFSFKVITSFGVAGYPGGSHKPASTWYLQASNKDSDFSGATNSWANVWTGPNTKWSEGVTESYPPPIGIAVDTPGSYRYYRIYASSYTNGYLLVCNWAMYECA